MFSARAGSPFHPLTLAGRVKTHSKALQGVPPAVQGHHVDLPCLLLQGEQLVNDLIGAKLQHAIQVAGAHHV